MIDLLRRQWRKLRVIWRFITSLYAKTPPGCCDIYHKPLSEDVHEECGNIRSMGA